MNHFPAVAYLHSPTIFYCYAWTWIVHPLVYNQMSERDLRQRLLWGFGPHENASDRWLSWQLWCWLGSVRGNPAACTPSTLGVQLHRSVTCNGHRCALKLQKLFNTQSAPRDALSMVSRSVVGSNVLNVFLWLIRLPVLFLESWTCLHQVLRSANCNLSNRHGLQIFLSCF